MAGSVEHLAITMGLIRLWEPDGSTGPRILRPERFLLGNICPDGIMSRKGYERPMKMHTHFRDGIPDNEFFMPENLERFHRRVREFAEEMLDDPTLERDLYLGYLTHILTDEIFILTVRPEFMERISVIGLTQKDARTFQHFTYDVDQIDFRLGREYPGMDWAVRCLRDAEPYEIRGILSERELTDSRRWILGHFFDGAPQPKPPVYYTYERAIQFIGEAVAFVDDNIGRYLPESVQR